MYFHNYHIRFDFIFLWNHLHYLHFHLARTGVRLEIRDASLFLFIRGTMRIISVEATIDYFSPPSQVLVWVGNFADHQKSRIAARLTLSERRGSRASFEKVGRSPLRAKSKTRRRAYFRHAFPSGGGPESCFFAPDLGDESWPRNSGR